MQSTMPPVDASAGRGPAQASNTGALTGLPESIALEGHVFAQTKALLESLSSRNRFQVLKALGGCFGHRVFAGTSPPIRNVPVPGQAIKSPGSARSSKSAKQIELEKEIKELNSKISSRSTELGRRLNTNDPLLVRRDHCFRCLHEQKSGRKSSTS